MKHAQYFAIEITFVALVALAALRIETLLARPVGLLVVVFVLGAFATLRMARTISYNAVAAWLRAPFTHIVKDTSGAGENVEPNEGSVIGELLCCPICSGTWSALVLVNLLIWVWPFGLALVLVLGLAGISEVMHWDSERAEWEGRAAREQAGSEWLRKNWDPAEFALPPETLAKIDASLASKASDPIMDPMLERWVDDLYQ